MRVISASRADGRRPMRDDLALSTGRERHSRLPTSDVRATLAHMPICATCGQENPDIAKFCLACGAPLAAPPPTTEERKLIMVLFTDIVGSTAKAEQMDPEDVRARLAPYYVRLRSELERFGGTVEKFIGDAVVALFGAPVAHEDDPERAVRAAFAVCQAIDELTAEA